MYNGLWTVEFISTIQNRTGKGVIVISGNYLRADFWEEILPTITQAIVKLTIIKYQAI